MCIHDIFIKCQNPEKYRKHESMRCSQNFHQKIRNFRLILVRTRPYNSQADPGTADGGFGPHVASPHLLEENVSQDRSLRGGHANKLCRHSVTAQKCCCGPRWGRPSPSGDKTQVTQRVGVALVFTDSRELSLWLLHQFALHQSRALRLRFEHAGVV